MMDHFNATVFDGAMVATRRGFRVTKQKHNGLAFVNSSPQDTVISGKRSAAKQAVSLPVTGELKFVTNGPEDKKHQPPKRRTKKGRERERERDYDTPKPASIKQWVRRHGHRDSISTTSSESMDDYPTRKMGNAEHSLPVWASYRLPKNMCDSSMRLLFMCFAFAPSKHSLKQSYMYGKTAEKQLSVVQDPTALHVAVTLGALFDVVKSGKQESTGLTTLTSQLCSIINRRLNQNEGSGLVNGVTIHAVSALAIIAGYLGQHDHWHVHMQGLLRLIAVAGGQEKLHVSTLNAIRKADFVGAVSAATKPYVPFTGDERNIRYPLFQKHLLRNAAVTERHLNACHIDQSVVCTVADVVGYNDILEYSQTHKEASCDSTTDPDALMELHYFLKYQLLTHPEPLLEAEEVANLETRQVPSTTIAYADIKAIESAVRILALLYIRDPTVDLPCGENLLLVILSHHMKTILESRRAKHPEDSVIDPLLLEESYIAQKPTLIWMCIAGDCFETMTTGDYTVLGRPSVYKELLMEVIGLEASTKPDLISDDAMELCRCLDLRHIRGAHWDVRIALRHILGAIKKE